MGLDGAALTAILTALSAATDEQLQSVVCFVDRELATRQQEITGGTTRPD